jgi:galactokinase
MVVGMDQAASVISNPGAALYISFFPRLHAEPIGLPGASTTGAEGTTTQATPVVTTSTGAQDTKEAGAANASFTATVPSAPNALRGASFVILNSLVVNNKAIAAKTQYNLRVVETLVGARVLARVLDVPLDADNALHAPGTKRERITFREVLGRWLGAQEKKGVKENTISTVDLKAGLERLLATEIEKLKPVGAVEDKELGVTMEEMIQLSGLDKAEFEQVYLSWVEVEAERFQLYKRAKHVFSEALRVLEFREVCLQATSSGRCSPFLGRWST